VTVATVELRAGWRWPRLALRGVTTVVVALVLAQAALAGGFLSGNFEALAAHAGIGSLAAAGLLVQSGVAILLWRKGGGPGWPVIASLAQFLVAAALFPLGEERVLALHVPLAVVLTVGVASLMAWSWRGIR
jgi:hypothetical protein